MGNQPPQLLPDLQDENFGLGKHLTKKAQEKENLISVQKGECCKVKNHDAHTNKNNSRVKLYRNKG